MEKRPFNLDQRLYACAKMVRPKSRIIDVGTDHAYLPIWLYKNKIITRAIASDLRPGPILNAKKNIKKYGISDFIETKVCDGLYGTDGNDIDDIIIAGMGGNIISSIINSTTWLKDSSKHLILQPMSADEELRLFLKENNYYIEKEMAVISSNKVYSVMLARFSEKPFVCNEFYPYIGKLYDNIDLCSVTYITKKIKSIKKRILGLTIEGKKEKANELTSIVNGLTKLIER